MTDPRLVADVLVNLFGAFGTLVVAYGLRRADPRGPVTRRAVWALGLVAALFFMRCLAWSTRSDVAVALVQVLAAATPLAALLVAEGLLRRHAPRRLKLAILIASLIGGVVGILPLVPPLVSGIVGLVVTAGGFAAVGALLATRDPRGLTDGENLLIRRVVLATILLVPLIATDFRTLWPDIPIRFGAVGALVVLFFAFGAGRSTNGERAASLMIFAGIAGVFAFGYVATGHGDDAGQAIRASAVGLSGLIFAALFAEALGAQSERRRPADPLLTSDTGADFVAALKDHRLIGDARVLEDELTPLRHPAFDRLIAERPVLRIADAPWDREPRDHGVERATSLFMTYDATHVMRLSMAPLRVAIFALPRVSSDIRAESEIAAAQRIGELIFSRPGSP